MDIEPSITPEIRDPSAGRNQGAAGQIREETVWQRMFQALLDPRSIQWMLTIGGSLCVLGLIVWLVMAEVTLLFGYDVSAEWIAVVLSVTALAMNSIHSEMATSNKTLNRVLPSVGMVLSYLPILLGVVLHMRTTSWAAAQFHWDYPASWAMVVAMLIVAVCNRVSAHLTRQTNLKSSAVYFFFSAAGLLIAMAGLLRVLGMTTWSQQAPWMMLLPILYLIVSRLWRGQSAQQPLVWIAHTATVVILVHVFFTSLHDLTSFVPMEGDTASLVLGLVFAEATLFYLLAALFGNQSVNVYLAAAAACGGLWQWMGYHGVDSTYYTMFYAGVGAGCLGIARLLGLSQVSFQDTSGMKSLVTRGRGLALFHSGNGILTVACLSAFMQGLTGLSVYRDRLLELPEQIANREGIFRILIWR